MGVGMGMSREIEAGGGDEGALVGGNWVVCGQGNPFHREGEAMNTGGWVESGAGSFGVSRESEQEGKSGRRDKRNPPPTSPVNKWGD